MEPILAVDIGTSKISAVLCSIGRGTPKALAFAVVPSRGVEKGLIVDIQEAAQSVSQAVSEVTTKAGISVGRAHVVVAGGHTASKTSTGSVTVIASDKVVTEADKRAAVDDAVRKADISENEEVVHATPIEFCVDGRAIAVNPVGLAASVLESRVGIATGLATALANVSEVVHRSGLETAGIALKPVASSWGVVSEEQRSKLVHIDIGAGTTSMAVFDEGTLVHTCLLPIGGNHITRDVSLGLKLPLDIAEEIKIEFGSALGDEVDDMEFVSLPGENDQNKVVSRRYVCQIIQARLEEIFTFLSTELDNLKDQVIPARIALSGGSSRIPGITELAARILRIPAEMGVLRGLEGLPEDTATSLNATAVGLVHYAMEPHIDGISSRTLPPTVAMEVVLRIKDWLEGKKSSRHLVP